MSATKSVLVTGAAGFIGANLVRYLIEAGHDVHVLVGPSTDDWRLFGVEAAITRWNASLEDTDTVARVVAKCRPTWVFHAAAHGAYSTQRSVQRMVAANVVGTMNLVEACLSSDVESLVHTGSSSEYGYKEHAPAEDEWVDPNSHYAVTKAAATMYCRLSSLMSQRPLTTLRLYSVYGPWEEPSRLMPSLALLGMHGKLPPLVSPNVARDYVHVDDVVQACVRAAEASTKLGAVYNVGTGQQTSLASLVEVARRHLHVAAEPEWGSMDNRAWDTDVWVADARSIAEDLGWSPQWELAEGFARFVDWLSQDERRLAMYASRRSTPPT